MSDRKINNLIKKMRQALIEEALKKAPNDFCLLQIKIIADNFKNKKTVSPSDIDLLNEVAFNHKGKWWSEKKGFEDKLP